MDNSHDTKVTRQSLDLEMKKKLVDVTAVELVPLNGESFFVGALVKKETADPSGLARQIIEIGISRGVSLYPAVYREKDWPFSDQSLQGSGSSPSGLIDRFKAKREFPREFRRLITTTIRGQLACFEWIKSSSQVPRDLALGFAVAVLKDAFDLLFATVEQPFTGDNDSVSVFEKSFASTDFFDTQDICLYFRLVGLHYQARNLHRRSPQDHEPSFEWEKPLDEASRLLERFYRYVRETFTPEKDKVRQRSIKRIAVACSVGLALLGVTFLYIARRPRSSTVDKRLITKPGGIVGEYFNGTRFERKVLQRVDRQINLDTVRSPARGIRFDRFSIRWKGYLYIPKTGASYLCIESDDGTRVYVDGDLVINAWTIQPLHRICRKVRLKTGWFPIMVEYFEASGRATIRLLWGVKKKRVSLVPAQRFCCMR